MLIPTISLTLIDYLIILAYFIAVLIIGFKSKSSENSVSDYLIAGRTLTLPAFVATLVSSFYGGVLGIGEFTFRYGISGWLLYALPYYFFIAIFAFFLANKISKTHLYSIPDKLNLVYGRKVSIFGSMLIFLLSTPAPYLFMMGLLVQWIFAVNLVTAMIFSLAVSILYLIKGGFRSDVRVNIFEFIIMFTGFGIILPFCFTTLGGMEYLESRLPEQYLTFGSGISLQYFFAWFFIGAWVLVDPVFYQRCFAVKDKKTPKKGILISLGFWFIFDVMTTFAGLYSKAFFQDDLANPSHSFPVLADKILPAAARGFFAIGLIATIMSSLHSYIFISATTFGRDIISRIRNENEEKYFYNKTGMAVSALFSFAIASLIPSVVDIWYVIGTLIIPALLISVVSAYINNLRIHSKYIFTAMIASFSASLIYFIIGQLNKVDGTAMYLFSIEPMYPGLILGLIIYFIGFGKRKFLKTGHTV